MAKCFVIGDISTASSTASILRTRGVTARSFKAVHEDEGFFEACRKEQELQVVAFFLNSISKDVPAFLRGLRDNLPEDVGIHVLCEGQQNSLSKLSQGFADVVTVSFPLGSVQAEKVIMAHWFGDNSKKSVRRSGCTAAGANVVWDHTDQTTAKARLEAYVAQRQRLVGKDCADDIAVIEKPVEKSNGVGVTSQPKSTVATIAPPKPILPALSPLSDSLGQEQGFEMLLKGIKKNCSLPSAPARVNIVGKTGITVELDPRRVRLLPNNPRKKHNPGFTEESLSELGESIKTFGQLEDVSVCPIVGDPNYDAQLIDGERRHGGCLRAKVMLKATVREDVTPAKVRELYVLSVVRNSSKEPHTTLEFVEMVKVFRGPDYKMSRIEVAKVIGKSPAWVDQYALLATLHPEVLALVGDTRTKRKKGKDVFESGESEKRKLSLQLALLLVDIPRELQLHHAQEIIMHDMSFIQARRHILGIRRTMQIKRDANSWRQGRAFAALGTLTRKNLDAFGVISDMADAEMSSLLTGRSKGERNGVALDLRTLASNLISLADRIESKACE